MLGYARLGYARLGYARLGLGVGSTYSSSVVAHVTRAAWRHPILSADREGLYSDIANTISWSLVQ